MTKFEVLQRISGVKEFASLVFHLVKKSETEEELVQDLSTELTEEGLQTIMSVARSENYPLSLDGSQ